MSEDPASPVCYASQADDVYMGYAGRDEITAALNELLEAERAGARVALKAKVGTSDPAMSRLMADVHGDEARWCKMLTSQIMRIGATPSRKCGEFYGKAMAIPELHERLDFLNRDQAWVVRKLSKLIPLVRDDALHADLTEMKANHEENILTVQQSIDGHSQPLAGPKATG